MADNTEVAGRRLIGQRYCVRCAKIQIEGGCGDFFIQSRDDRDQMRGGLKETTILEVVVDMFNFVWLGSITLALVNLCACPQAAYNANMRLRPQSG